MFKNIQQIGLLNSLLSIDSFFYQSKRTTFILKRKFEVQLHKKNQKPIVRRKNYIYEFVKDTNVEKQEKIEFILTDFVKGLGVCGDVVSLKPNYAYNHLILNDLAVYKTPENLIKYSRNEADKKEEIFSSPEAPRTLDFIKRFKLLCIVMNKSNPWVIEPWHIRTSLRKVQIYVTDDAIELPSTPITGPDLLKENKEFYVTITINKREKIQIRCRVHHWSTDPRERLPYIFEHWKEDSEQLFGNITTNEENIESIEK